MKFLKKWMLNLLALTIILISPVICGYIIYLLYFESILKGVLGTIIYLLAVFIFIFILLLTEEEE